jgi:dTDP-4-amino-4,6-dideoxygalactose transaminase
MHQQTVFKTLGYKGGDFPTAEKLASSVFSLPMHPYLDIGKINEIILDIEAFRE